MPGLPETHSADRFFEGILQWTENQAEGGGLDSIIVVGLPEAPIRVPVALEYRPYLGADRFSIWVIQHGTMLTQPLTIKCKKEQGSSLNYIMMTSWSVSGCL